MYTYTVYTHPDGLPVDSDSGLQGTAVTETFSPALPCGADQGGGALNVNGQFTDNVAYCSNMPLTCSGQTTQTLSVGGFVTRSNSMKFSSDGVKVQSNGPSQ